MKLIDNRAARRLWLVLVFIILAGTLSLSCDDDDDDDNHHGDDDSSDDDDTGDENDDQGLPGAVNNEPPPWPEWALRHWVWEDESTQESVVAMIENFLRRDIPVGAVIIDSPWATGYSTFEFNPKAYPDPQQMIDDIHDLDVRVMLWTVPNVNLDSPNYQEGFDNNYYINDGRTAEWWKGPGSFIDYNNPEAMQWWHGMIDNVLDLGIDGWKTDGSEVHVYLWGGAQTYLGRIPARQYQAMYYRDFFEYTREQLGPDRLITARPVDTYGIPVQIPNFAPVDVNFAAWVGDQDPTWFGLKAALRNMLASADFGYVNVGSDIGGYRNSDLRDKELFIRWIQLGTFCSVMEHGNPGDHYPWDYDGQVLSIYRDFVKLHHALIPYLYSQGAVYYQNLVSLMRPVEKVNQWRYYLGDSLFVSPIVKPSIVQSTVFPPGTWIDFFTGDVYQGPATEQITYPLDRFPVYVRQGAVIPLALTDSVFDLAPDQPLPITVAVYPKQGVKTAFDFYEEGGTGARIEADYGSEIELSLSATTRAFGFKLMDVDLPQKVSARPAGDLTKAESLDQLRPADSGWVYLEQTKELWIKPGGAQDGLIITISW